MQTRYNPFPTNEPLYFDTFQCSSAITQKELCGSIHWQVQSPAKYLRWSLFLKAVHDFLMILMDGEEGC